MKIGVLTFHCAHNYGAVLQAYALQEFLKKEGHDVEIIDYRPYFLIQPYAAFYWIPLKGCSFLKKIKRLCWNFYENTQIILRIKRRSGFLRFINNKLCLSKNSYFEDSNVIGDYDAFIIGSDQVWNPSLSQGFDRKFWGDFIIKEGAFRLTYAASSGKGELILLKNRLHLEELIKNFKAISVRERNLAEIVQPFCEKKVETVLDPTLILDKDDWENILIKPKVNGKYVLIYQIMKNDEIYSIAKSIAREINAEIIEIASGVGIKILKKGIKAFLSPEEFLGYFEYASCVITTSFHGVAFSIIHNKPFFYVSKNDIAENRIKSLLKELNLENRLIIGKSIPKFSLIDYNEVNKMLVERKNKSRIFLRENLINKNEV